MPVVEVEGRPLKLSNLDKVLYPATGFTKAEVIDYYARIAPVLLRHCADRFVTLKRYPEGVDSKPFFEKNCPRFKPDWMSTNDYTGSEGSIRFCRIDSLAAVTWTANLAALELHTSMARSDDPDTPTMVVFDLDPGEPADVLTCAEVALWLRHIFDDLDLRSVVKTSGSKGIQVYVPLNTPATHDEASAFSHTIAQLLEQAHPDRIVSVQRKELRVGKVLVDWSQNSRHKTTVCAYSLRAREHPTVSTPMTWDEIAAAHDAGDRSLLTFETGDVLDRIDRLGDLWAPTLTVEQSLPAL
ncbi:MAG: non-homologous end-joining DNA ligase [Acidobacteria bacterium]|nr:non-homologous end-joining DNA ligase [Acidobacteriota bacterium]